MGKRAVRIFQVAKELNISHTEILTYLKKNDIDVASHMSPVNDEIYQMILTEFAKDKATVERYRKEQVRREIHDTRFKENQVESKKLKLLSLKEQRQLEEDEKKKALEAEKARKAAEEKRQAELEAKAQQEEELSAAEEAKKVLEENTRQKELEEKKKKETEKKPKKKLRRVSLTEIRGDVGKGTRREKKKDKTEDAEKKRTAKERVRQTMAKMDTKGKKKVYRKERVGEEIEEIVDGKPIQITEFSSVDELAKIFETKPNDVIQKCLGLGILATINQRLEWDVIELVAEDFGFKAEKMEDVGEDLFSFEDTEEDLANAESRSPVVTVMGHVDHGKTSLLDYIRESNVVSGESGGITQHIGASRVELDNKKSITFLDTPGHEAFTAMRARGAQVTDMVILVVAANDGVMPQTIEAIDHAKAAEVPLIIAINKMDLTEADVDRVKRELSEHNVLVEDWGGKVQAIPISAKTGEGIEDLMTSVLIEAEMLELKANKDTMARGIVIDSKLDKGHGPIATVLIQKGTLNVGNPFICNTIAGKVRAMMNERGLRVKMAGPSEAVQVLGFDQVPQSADVFAVVDNEREMKRIASDRQRLKREIDQKKIKTQTLDEMSAMIKEGTMKTLPIIIKGDVDGSIEALAESLEKLGTDEVGIQVIHKSVGIVSESDVLLAAASNAVIIGFHVQVSSNAKLQAKQEGVEIRTYTVIYNAVEELTLALEGMLEPDIIEETLGQAIVQTSFKIPKLGFIAGSKVTDGIIIRGALARVIRDEEEIASGNITSLKRFKDDAKEVKDGLECGIGVEGVKTFKEGDIIVCYKMKSIKRTLETR